MVSSVGTGGGDWTGVCAMLAMIIALVGQAAIVASTSLNPNALFDRDPAIREWAVRLHDTNHDGWLTLYEAQDALAAFKVLADGNSDGQGHHLRK